MQLLGRTCGALNRLPGAATPSAADCHASGSPAKEHDPKARGGAAASDAEVARMLAGWIEDRARSFHQLVAGLEGQLREGFDGERAGHSSARYLQRRSTPSWLTARAGPLPNTRPGWWVFSSTCCSPRAECPTAWRPGAGQLSRSWTDSGGQSPHRSTPTWFSNRAPRPPSPPTTHRFASGGRANL